MVSEELCFSFSLRALVIIREETLSIQETMIIKYLDHVPNCSISLNFYLKLWL